MDPRHHVNPYIAGSPVTGTEMFYGRQDVFAFIRRNLIGRHRDTPVVLYGQRRTGKTSVLYQLNRHLDADYRCIFIDLHGLNLSSMGNLLLGVAGSISRSLRRDHQLTISVPSRTEFLADPRATFESIFLDKVWPALGHGHLVLMLDEVVRLDEKVKAGDLEQDVFEYLRYLMQHYPQLNFIFSLGSGLEEMAKNYAFLFSVALYHRISFLEPEAARELITQPVRDHYQLAAEAVETILDVTSGHPYYTQLVCHCLFDLWSRSPKEIIEAADVGVILPEAVELGSANLTYVWRDSTEGEKAVMAAMAAAMRGEARPVTLGQARDEWRAIGVSLPEGEAARSLRSLTSREVLAGDQKSSFTVDLQRLWLERHRRLDWVKDEIAQTAQEWNRSAEPWPADAISARSEGKASAADAASGRTRTGEASGTSAVGRRRMSPRSRYVLSAGIVVAVALYLAATSAVRVFPFSRPVQALSSIQSITPLVPGTLSQNPDACHRTAAPPHQWNAHGLLQVLHCTDSNLKGGDVYIYQLDNLADSSASWQSFNRWWKFPSAAGADCPPSGAVKGRKTLSGSQLPEADRVVLECGLLTLGSGGSVPVYAYSFPAINLLVIAQGATDSSFSALDFWATHKTVQKHG